MELSLFEIDLQPGLWYDIDVFRVGWMGRSRAMLNVCKYSGGDWEVQLLFFNIT